METKQDIINKIKEVSDIIKTFGPNIHKTQYYYKGYNVSVKRTLSKALKNIQQ